MDTGISSRAPRERDFLDELQRQRDEAVEHATDGSVGRDDEIAALVGGTPRVERSVGEPVPAKRPTTYDADDLEIPSFLRRK
jgi:hypothetical protein